VTVPTGRSSSNISGFNEGLAFVRINHKAAYIDKTDKIIIALKYDSGGDFNKGVARIIDGDEADTQRLYYIGKPGKSDGNKKPTSTESSRSENVCLQISPFSWLGDFPSAFVLNGG